MRKHLTLNSLTSLSSNKKAAGTSSKTMFTRRSERHDVSPREFVIRNILNYSLALAVIPTRDAGNMKILMN